MIDELEWEWPCSNGKPFKVILNMLLGTLEVINPNGDIIIRRTHLTKKQMMFLYQRFKNKLKIPPDTTNPLRPEKFFDPMIT